MSFNHRGALLTAVMIGALVTVVAGGLGRFNPTWQPAFLIGACFLVALEAGFVHYAARRERMAFGELARYLVPELVVLAVLMRLAATLSLPATSIQADMERWLYDPLSIFEPLFILYLLVGFLTGTVAHLSMRDLSDLAPKPFENPELLSDSGRRLASQLAEDRAGAIRRVGSRFVLGGALLLMSLGLEAVNLDNPTGPSQEISTSSTIGVLTYGIAGFLLYSQARLALLRARWQQEGSAVAEGVMRRWHRTAWLLIVGVVGGAALLPRTYGRGLLETLNAGLALVGYVVAVLAYLVVWLFGMLVALPAWLLSLLLPPASGATRAPPPPPEIPPLPPEVEREPRLLPALIFWLCMVALAIYAARIVLQRHPELLSSMMQRGVLGRLLGWLAELWRDTSSWSAQAARIVGERLRRPQHTPPRSRGRLIRLGGLGPRELVRYFYHSTLRRAATGGVGRKTGQTPYEYGASLAAQLPETGQDIAELTEAFVVAQYSRRALDAQEAGRVRGPWARLRRSLRHISQGAGQPSRIEQSLQRDEAAEADPRIEPRG
jgi:hypothetical protein